MIYSKTAGKSKVISIIILLLLCVVVNCKKKKITPMREEKNDEADINLDIFCKNQTRLIKMEKADEIFVVDSFVNDSVLLQCKFCEEKDNGLPKTWSRQKHIFTGNITEVESDMDNNSNSSSIYITKDHSLVFSRLQESDMGLYFCKAPYMDTPDKSFNYLIDMSSKAPEEIRGTTKDLKNYTQFYLQNFNKKLSNVIFSVDKFSVMMKLFSDWSVWSECDSCFRKEGVMYRTGRCRIKPVCKDSKECQQQRRNFKSFMFNDRQNTEKPMVEQGEVANVTAVEENILEFGISLSCRSLLLWKVLPYLHSKTSLIPDFVHSEKCKAPCKGKSLKKGPRYRKSIILAKGAHLTLVCPDSTIDSQVRWEHNKRRLHPNEGMDFIPGSTEPRLYVDSFNTLYLFEVTNRESGNFTCFVDGMRMQEVKIIVLTRSLFFTKEYTRHLKYLGIIFMVCFVGYVSGVVVMCVKSHAENKRNVRRIREDSEKLLRQRNEETDTETDYYE